MLGGGSTSPAGGSDLGVQPKSGNTQPTLGNPTLLSSNSGLGPVGSSSDVQHFRVLPWGSYPGGPSLWGPTLGAVRPWVR